MSFLLRIILTKQDTIIQRWIYDVEYRLSCSSGSHPAADLNHLMRQPATLIDDVPHLRSTGTLEQRRPSPHQPRRYSPPTSAFSTTLVLSSPSIPILPRSGPLKPARGSGERCKLPQWGLVRSPSRHRFWCILRRKKNSFDNSYMESPWFTMHNCNKFKYIFIFFGENHPDTSL